MPRLFSFIYLVAATSGHPQTNPDFPLDRPYTLLNQEPALLESEYHRMISGDGARSYIFPRACLSETDGSRVCARPSGFGFADSAGSRMLNVSPIGGYEYRYLGSHVHAADFGALAQGGSGPLSFYLDARMFIERYDDLYHPSYDREFVERQGAEASDAVAYTSYSRYRSNLSYDLPWGRLTAARDGAHWGPGLFTNLVFQQDGIPFNQLTFTSRLGPVGIQSLYGQLAANGDWEFDTSSFSKSIYAHRYELQAGRDLVLGVSEQLILYKVSAPFAFVPIIPLFITKATEKERLNNGNIAADFSWRVHRRLNLYSEFLIDDIQAPTSLFSDTWSNKWAWMAGAHWIGSLGPAPAGLIAEYSRVEPWVYTHYLPHTAQTAHMDYPLGNPYGPNSQAMIVKAYARAMGGWYASLRGELVWKGTSVGSGIEDIHTRDSPTAKEFIAGVSEPRATLYPYLWYNRGIAAYYASLAVGGSVHCEIGTQIRY